MSNLEKVQEIDAAINKRLLEVQKVEFEKDIENIMMQKKSKGRSSAIFSSLKTIAGDKNVGQEQISMIDPKTKLQIFEAKEIKRASLEYCCDLLNSKKCEDEDFGKYFFIEDMIHLVRSAYEDETYEEITRDDFDKRLKLLKSKNKDKYEFLVKSGQGMKDCLFELFCKVWATEKKPQQWRDTIII